jgi:hypothetical protein
MKYRVVDRVVHSAVPLPELQRAAQGAAHTRIERGESGPPPRRNPYHFWNTPQGYRWATFWRDGERRVMHFARTAQFVIDDGARVVTCHPIGRTSDDAWRPVLLNQVFPLLLGEERLVLHASAVATPSGAFVFVGAPGRGKSTLSTALAVRGLPLISDDFVVVGHGPDGPVALPSGVEPRLWPDSVDAILPGGRRRFPVVTSRSEKRRIPWGVPLAAAPQRIARVFVLTPPATDCQIESLPPGDAVSALTASTFVGRIDDRGVVRQTFERVTSLIATVRTEQFVTVRDWARLDAMCQLVDEVTGRR